MSDPRDLSGVWYGSYAAYRYEEANSFIAVIEEVNGALSGTITEPDDAGGGGGIRRASVSGVRDGSALRFTKQYDGTGGWVHSVRYAGQVDAQGVQVSGAWVVEGLTGAFNMSREKFIAEELEREEEEEILLSGGVSSDGRVWR